MPDNIVPNSPPPLPEVEGVRHRFLTLGGLRWHVAEAGDPAQPALVLLHGFPQHWYMWRDVFEPLARRRHVLAIDLRGSGWSDAPPTGYSTAQRGLDVLAILDAIGVSRADVVGHNWGAWLAFRLALEHPNRVRRLVAISMMHPWPRQRHLAPTAWRWWITALFEWPAVGPWLLRRRPGVTRWLLSRDAADRSVWTDPLRNAYASVAAQPRRAKAAQRLHLSLLPELPRAILGLDRRRTFASPTLVLVGDHDALVPPSALAVPPSRSDTVRLQSLPGGHYLVDENPAGVSAAILHHLDDTVSP